MRQPENEEEVLALGYTAKESYQSPSHYVFGPNLPIQSQYEIDVWVTAVRKEHEAELLEEQKRDMAQGSI